MLSEKCNSVLFTPAQVKLYMKVLAGLRQELPDDVKALLHGTGLGAAKRDHAGTCDG